MKREDTGRKIKKKQLEMKIKELKKSNRNKG